MWKSSGSTSKHSRRSAPAIRMPFDDLFQRLVLMKP
jgi:hypothetical protein